MLANTAFRTATLALTLSLALLLAGHAGATQTRTQAKRVVAIGGSITEIVHALGEQSRLVARDSTSTYPQAAQELPDVGYMRALSPEGVLSVDPDLIIALEGAGPPEAVEVLKKASVPYVEVAEDHTGAGILAKIRTVAEALGVPEKGAELAGRVEADLAETRRFVAAHPTSRRVMFILSLQGGRPLASGRGTAAHGIIEMAGATNALAAFEGYKQVNDEAVLEAAPEAVLMIARGGDHGATREEAFALPALKATPAAEAGRFISMDGLYLLGFGPRTAAAARDLARALIDGAPAHD